MFFKYLFSSPIHTYRANSRKFKTFLFARTLFPAGYNWVFPLAGELKVIVIGQEVAFLLKGMSVTYLKKKKGTV